MAAPMLLLAWGLWCLIRAPVHALRYTEAGAQVMSPLELRLMGGFWCLLGGAGVLASLGP